MIHPSELRIGNIVSVDTNRMEVTYAGIEKHSYWRVVGLLEDKAYITALGDHFVHEVSYEWLEGVALTEEMLEITGFSKDDKYGRYVLLIPGSHPKFDRWLVCCDPSSIDEWVLEDGISDSQNYYVRLLQFTHLHQLQNLFFVLSGKELNFKP